ncbi:MAG: glycosyltransferase family 2 protein [Spirochaetales bacterium]|jgi:glycosyltransferase involved in cell wall biosynthesis|nr:glycosyltransferase family 2 protein [Spirochaetales bacterium]
MDILTPFKNAGAGAPEVSVIIPHFNRPDLLKEAVASVAAQTFRDFELIVADDGSEAGVISRLLDLARAWEALAAPSPPAFRLLRFPHSGFPGAVRNRGAAAARGGYLAFLDSDDLYRPDKLEKQATFFRNHPDCLLCHTREVWLRSGREVSQKGQRHRRRGDVFADSLKKCILGPSTVMMSAPLFRSTGGFAENLEIAEDYEYWLRLSAQIPVEYIEEALTIKRAGSWPQLSEKYGQIEIFRIRALRRLLEQDLLPPPRRREARQTLGEKCLIYGRGCEKRGRPDEAAEYFSLAARYLDGEAGQP